MGNARITYLYHSGYVVETDNHFMIFDYYMDDIAAGQKRGLDAGVISFADLPKDKKITVFVTHNHADHFNPVIFKWKKDRANIEYVVSSDVKTRAKATRMAPYEHVDINGLSVDTYGSTDAGVAFAVIADGLNIYHAGDFNLWHWIEESTQEEVKFAKRAFLREMENLKDLYFDVAFFPVDPRMGRGYDAGAAHFARTLHPALMVPMHFGKEIQAAETFRQKMMAGGQLCWAPQERGDYCDFDPQQV